MKTILLIFIAIAISSCTPTENVSYIKKIGMSENGPVLSITIDGHDYIDYGQGVAHSGICKRCKQERDSIVNLIINTIKNGRTDNQR